MRIGIFDSGLGGLAIAQAIIREMPHYDYLYLGDTKRVPYGNRSQESIHQFTSEALEFLFQRDCQLVIIACNTASAEALRKTQQEYLPNNFPDRNVLGVIIPTVEEAVQGSHRVGVLATASTVASGAYATELQRQNPVAEVFQQAAPLLVPLIENDGLKYVDPILEDYLSPLLQAQVDSVILGCTHYSWLKDLVRSKIGVKVVSQDEIVPSKLKNYLARHPEHETKLGRNGVRRYCVTDLTVGYEDLVTRLSGTRDIQLEKVELRPKE